MNQQIIQRLFPNPCGDHQYSPREKSRDYYQNLVILTGLQLLETPLDRS